MLKWCLLKVQHSFRTWNSCPVKVLLLLLMLVLVLLPGAATTMPCRWIECSMLLHIQQPRMYRPIAVHVHVCV